MSAAAKITPDEKRAQLLKVLQENTGRREKFAQGCQEIDVRNADTIAMLERRTKERFVNVELPGGDIVPIKPSLSEVDVARLDKLREEFTRIRSLTKDEQVRLDSLKAEMNTIRMVTPDSVRRVREITLEIEALHTTTPAENTRLKRLDFEIVEIITADPELTATWLENHPGAFSYDDLLWIITEYKTQQLRQDRARGEKIAAVRSFR
jgi:hypothetical protein